jgi:hypothetical protein
MHRKYTAEDGCATVLIAEQFQMAAEPLLAHIQH